MGGPMLQNQAIQGAQNSTKFYVQAAERKLSHRFPRQMTKNYCVSSVSANKISLELSPILLLRMKEGR